MKKPRNAPAGWHYALIELSSTEQIDAYINPQGNAMWPVGLTNSHWLVLAHKSEFKLIKQLP